MLHFQSFSFLTTQFLRILNFWKTVFKPQSKHLLITSHFWKGKRKKTSEDIAGKMWLLRIEYFYLARPLFLAYFWIIYNFINLRHTCHQNPYIIGSSVCCMLGVLYHIMTAVLIIFSEDIVVVISMAIMGYPMRLDICAHLEYNIKLTQYYLVDLFCYCMKTVIYLVGRKTCICLNSL